MISREVLTADLACSLVKPQVLASLRGAGLRDTMGLEWSAETLRVSLFSSNIVKLTPDDWKKVTGTDVPEAEQKVVGRHTMSGPFLEGQLSLSASGSRFDCVLAASPPADSIPEAYIPSVGHWPEVCKEFFAATKAWVEGIGVPIVRMAIGPVLLARQPGAEDAYKSLLGMVKSLKGDPARMRDLLFRVNWPVNSTSVNGLTINRLTSWAVLRIQFQIVVGTGANVLVDAGPGSDFVRLEIDHNTDAGRTQPFDQKRLVPLYNELTNLAMENAEKGELP
jgi:hypothetical protein